MSTTAISNYADNALLSEAAYANFNLALEKNITATDNIKARGLRAFFGGNLFSDSFSGFLGSFFEAFINSF